MAKYHEQYDQYRSFLVGQCHDPAARPRVVARDLQQYNEALNVLSSNGNGGRGRFGRHDLLAVQLASVLILWQVTKSCRSST